MHPPTQHYSELLRLLGANPASGGVSSPTQPKRIKGQLQLLVTAGLINKSVSHSAIQNIGLQRVFHAT